MFIWSVMLSCNIEPMPNVVDAGAEYSSMYKGSVFWFGSRW